MHVLLAEDTPVSAEITQAMAQRLGVKLDIAANGLEAIEMVEAARRDGNPYTLLLADVMMPVVDGIEMTRQLRASGISPAQMPIIAVTAATEVGDIRSYRAAGMQAFLEKPISLKDLRAVFHAWGHDAPLRKANIRAHTMAMLTRQFDDRKAQALAAIEAALEAGGFSDEAVMNIRMQLHQIAGTAGSFGDARLGERAKAHEQDLMSAFSDRGDIGAALESARDLLRASN